MTFWIALILVLLHVIKGGWALVALIGTAIFEVSTPFFWLWQSQRRPVQVGSETLIGETVVVAEECRPYGRVRAQGEFWRARCDQGADRGDRVRIVGRDGLTLLVAREP